MASTASAKSLLQLVQRGAWMQAQATGGMARTSAALIGARSKHTAAPALGASIGGGSTGGAGGGSGGANPGGGPGGDGGARRFGLWSLLASGGQLALLAGSASARKQEPPPPPQATIDSTVDSLWAVAGPILTNLGFSGCVGVAAGMALKKVGQFVAVLIGLAFMALQGLAYAGYITVNWSNVHKDVNRAFDLNKDGKVDSEDFKYFMRNFLGVAAHGVPSVGGFLAGFALGLRM